MEFWGIDRSRNSLRLAALNSITRINELNDASCIIHGIPETNFTKLSATEVETLLAFAQFIENDHNQINTTTNDNNTKHEMLSVLKMAPIMCSEINFNMNLLSTETWFLRLKKNPSKLITRSIIKTLVMLKEFDEILKFLKFLESMLNTLVTIPQKVAFSGSLIGCLEALSSKKLDMDFFLKSFPILLNFDSQNFDFDFDFDFGVHFMDITHLVSQIFANICPDVTNKDFLNELTSYCFDKYDKLELLESTDEQSFELVRLSMCSCLEIMHSMFMRKIVKSELFYTYVLRALTYKDREPLRYATSLAKMCASITLNHEKRLVQILELLPGFLSELDSHIAHQSAVSFAQEYMKTRSSKAFRIRAIYAITNKITAEEIDSLCESNGEQRMLECLAAMLSALVAFVKTFDSEEIADLTVTILEQKLGSINLSVDCQVVETWGLLTPYISHPKLKEVLELLVYAGHNYSSSNRANQLNGNRGNRGNNNPGSGRASMQTTRGVADPIVTAITNARVQIAKYRIDDMLLVDHLLNLVIHKTADHSNSWATELFKPLAELLSYSLDLSGWKNQETFRNAWFNLALQGVTRDKLEGEDLKNFRTVAKWAPPLVCEESANHIESDLKLNSVLCRGASDHVLKVQKLVLSQALGAQHVQNSDDMKIMFLGAAFLLESLRMQSGSISKLPHYFEDTEFTTPEGHSQMTKMVNYLMQDYINSLGYEKHKDLLSVSNELCYLLVLSCHRVEVVRKTAHHMISQIVSVCPAALGQHSAIFTLLECLSLLKESIDNCVADKFSPKTIFKSELANITLQLNDDIDARQHTFKFFEKSAYNWVELLNLQMREDLRSKLFTYLSHDSVRGEGRRFALSLLTRDDVNDDVIVKYVLLNQYDTNVPLQPIDTVIQLLHTTTGSDDLHKVFAMAAPILRADDHFSIQVAQECVRAPFRIFTYDAINAGITFWHYVIRHQNNLRSVVVSEVLKQTVISAQQYRGLFNQKLDLPLPVWSQMEYAPTNKRAINRHEKLLMDQFLPHSKLITGFIKSSVHNSVLLSANYLSEFVYCFLQCLEELKHGSKHILAFNFRLELFESAIDLLHIVKSLVSSYSIAQPLYKKLETAIYQAVLSWYDSISTWPYGSNIEHQKTTLLRLKQLASWLSKKIKHGTKWELVTNFVLQDVAKLEIWLNPLVPKGRVIMNSEFTVVHLKAAWEINPQLAVSICRSWRFSGPDVEELLINLIAENPLAVYDNPEALTYYMQSRTHHHIVYWAQVSPIVAINLLGRTKSKFAVQYALRALQLHPIDLCFFYVPQVVQQLRHDESGYVEEYILEAAKVSQKFAHQIIWNIMANMYIDDDATVPSDMKPKLEHVIEKMKSEFSNEDRKYYETEFSFFSEITGISGKLKPYIKKSKPEKKAKIDEEMAKIEVPENVYLPSHPDGVVIDIDRTSGKPLQSHAKAPFLAKFKIRVNEEEIDENNEIHKTQKDVWQGAIFKVGDDCRQDVLALQLISVFRSIFNYSGLDVWVFPYKVTATAAGRGIIDVLPNSVSRDMLGREAVNGLVQWYHSKHGGPDSLAFQRARLNFVKSMASYSVISYLIQFKDRHNGNIMYDDEGHVIHIDFGFCFDITPGGVRFEAAPFKLTKEMVQVMGGSAQAVPFKWFEEQCVRVYLASRLYIDDICRVVEPMLESGLPCFKSNTIKKLRERFVPQKTDAEAAQYMRSLIHKSYESNFTKGYDEFQKFTNGIPY